MSEEKDIVEEFIEEIESSIELGFNKDDFVIKFRNKIDKIIEEEL